MKCDGYRILIREMLQGKLNVDEVAVVATHMDACESCRSFHRELVGDRCPSGESVVGTPVAREKSSDTHAGVIPIVIGVILMVLLLLGLVFIAKDAGWHRSDRLAWYIFSHSRH